MPPSPPHAPRTVGRYLLGEPIGVGGTASVHVGLLAGPSGFGRAVALKRMHEALAADAQARLMLLDEARVTARLHHANLVPTLDVVDAGAELYLVQEYVHGESVAKLAQRAKERGARVPAKVAAAVVAGALRGLHAAHEATGPDGAPLELVHRDVTPGNILVDSDGVARVTDFGIARARGRLQATREGQLKGTLAYLAPEQVHGDASRRSDVFAAGVVLFELVTGAPLFAGENEAATLSRILLCQVPPLGDAGRELPGLEAVLQRALALDAAARFPTALAMAEALESAGVASPSEVARWVAELAADTLKSRRQSVDALEAWAREHEASGAPAAAEPAAVKPAPSRRPAGPLLAAATLGVALVAFGVLQLVGRGASGPTAEPKPAVAAPTGPAAAPEPTPAPEVAKPAVTEAPAEPVAPTKPVTEAPASEARPPRAPSKAGPSTKPANCSPPFVIDSQGVKRFKVECLK